MNCICCNKESLMFSIKAKNNIKIYKCTICDGGQILGDSKDEVHDYSDYGDYWENLPSKYFDERNKISFPKKIFFNFLKITLGQNSSILDFGGGAGFFAKKCLKAGFNNTYLFEPSNKLRSIAENKVGIPKKNIIAKISEIKDESIDMIIMLDVIEHLPIKEGYSIIVDLQKKLKKNGIFAGVTPNFKSLNIILHGNNDPVISPPSHSIYFTVKSLHALLLRTGFKKFLVFTSGFSTNSFFRKNNNSSWIERPNMFQKIPAKLVKLLFIILSIPLSLFFRGYHINYIYKKI